MIETATLVSTTLYVRDVQSTTQFYENVFGFRKHCATPKQNYAQLTLDTTSIHLASIGLAHYNLDTKFINSTAEALPFGITLTFRVPEASKIIKKAMAEGATMIQPLLHKPWQQAVGYLRDPNGFLIEILEMS